MAEGISVTECAEEKMLVEENSQNNGLVLDKDGDELILEFNPRPQRTLKMNRRGLFLMNREEEKESNEISPGTVNPCKRKDTNKLEDTDRLKSPPSVQKVIKLTSQKSASESQNGLKRSCSNLTSNGMDQKSPSKKKHKPITWP